MTTIPAALSNRVLPQITAGRGGRVIGVDLEKGTTAEKRDAKKRQSGALHRPRFRGSSVFDRAAAISS